MPNVPAQVMTISDVAGFDEETIRRGLRASNGTAVFVRYPISMACTPWPARDGALDTAGTHGLYVGTPRPRDRWIDGRPTFDMHKAPHLPLPQRYAGPSGYSVSWIAISTPHMSADELLTMYRARGTETVSVTDTSVHLRIRR